MAIIKQASRQTLGQLIGANNPPVIVPNDSQRQYAWTKKEVNTYWEDIRKFLAARESGVEAAAEYFIGPIVTITEEKITTRGLLDGQQRLSTSTILISVLRDHLWRIETAESRVTANNIQRDYIARKAGRKEPLEYFLTLSLFDREYFRDSIQHWSDTDGNAARKDNPTRPSHRLIRDARTNFDAKISSVLAEIKDVEARLDWIESLYEGLVKGLVFVEIQTPTSSDANEVFETINSRGKDLSTVDLVRNFLMEKARNKDEQDRVNDTWRVMLDGFGKREQIERFLRHYWVARHGDVKAHSLYTTIRADLAPQFEKAQQGFNVGMFATELQNDSTRYMELISSNTGIPEFDASLAEVDTLGSIRFYLRRLADMSTASFSL